MPGTQATSNAHTRCFRMSSSTDSPRPGRRLECFRAETKWSRFFEDFQRTFPDAQTASHEFIEGSDGTVIVGFRVSGSGRSSGAGTEMQIWQVWQVSDELAPLGVTEFSNREDALNTAGVMESSARGAE